MTFTTFAKVENPSTNNAEVRNITYHVEKDGVEIANSGPISAGAPQSQTDQNGVPIERYTTNWNYTIPADNANSSTYRVYAKIVCGYKTQATVAPQSVPLKQAGILDRIIFFFMDILGIQHASAAGGRVPTVANPIFEGTEPVNYVEPSANPTDFNTVKLGTFDPLTTPTPSPKLGCKQVIFQVGPPLQ